MNDRIGPIGTRGRKCLFVAVSWTRWVQLNKQSPPTLVHDAKKDPLLLTFIGFLDEISTLFLDKLISEIYKYHTKY